MLTNNQFIYLDNAATTKVNEEVLQIYNDISINRYANSSSIHFFGASIAREIDKAREDIKRLLNVNNHRVIFTSGATEANNLCIKGIAFKYKNRGKHIIVSQMEHPSVLETARQLEQQFGYEVTYLPTDEKGIISLKDLESSLRNDTILVSIIAVNNETGAINPISEIIKIIKRYPKAFFHVDVTQAIGKIDLPYNDIDAFSYSFHKIHGLKGGGALLLKNNITPLTLASGGGQEEGFRSGTLDSANIISSAKALEIAIKGMKNNYAHIKSLKDKLMEYLLNNQDLYEINSPEESSIYILNFSTLTKKASVVVEALSNHNIMVSSISACHSKKEKYSHVVSSYKKMNIAMNTIRVSFDASNALEEMDIFISILDKIIKEIKQ